ncbi:expressed unknown protein [Seminavis robusta]|uniref:Uncharacterized protein n=1 Tax=Seminavis robusta TaxID=568900 RepID=A0A9N8E459_9STRA|nr:expressed unknown protein [Seminavis robusta]|eukprot:Sro601_g173541.1  (119) ;mRNA; r:32245-32601
MQHAIVNIHAIHVHADLLSSIWPAVFGGIPNSLVPWKLFASSSHSPRQNYRCSLLDEPVCFAFRSSLLQYRGNWGQEPVPIRMLCSSACSFQVGNYLRHSIEGLVPVHSVPHSHIIAR